MHLFPKPVHSSPVQNAAQSMPMLVLDGTHPPVLCLFFQMRLMSLPIESFDGGHPASTI